MTSWNHLRGDARICVLTSLAMACRNLSYYYPGSTVPALVNVNFTLQAGETLAIVGLNGSGEPFLAYMRFQSSKLIVFYLQANRRLPRSSCASPTSILRVACSSTTPTSDRCIRQTTTRM